MSEPDAEADPRPWEQPGGFRRDCLPHRGRLLGVVSTAAAVCAVLGCIVGFTAPLAVVLGVGVWVVARRDLREMGAGRMDPAGREATEVARETGVWSLALTLLPLLVCCYFGWYLLVNPQVLFWEPK
jgi:hypothetical protein